MSLPFSIPPFRLDGVVLRKCCLHLAVNYLEYVVFLSEVALTNFTQLLHAMSARSRSIFRRGTDALRKGGAR